MFIHIHALPPSLLPLLGEEGTFSDSSSSARVAGVVVVTEGFAGLDVGKGPCLWKGQPWNGNLCLKKPAIALFGAGSASILAMEGDESTSVDSETGSAGG